MKKQDEDHDDREDREEEEGWAEELIQYLELGAYALGFVLGLIGSIFGKGK